MSVDSKDRYIFEAEWFDKIASTLKKFYLYFYPSDNSVELFDLKTRKLFLRRTKCDGVESKDFYIGGTVTIFSRNMKITGFADNATKKRLSALMEKTFGMLKPEVIDKMGEIFKRITDYNFHITNIKMVKLSSCEALELYSHKEESKLPSLVEYITSGPVVAFELFGEDAVTRWRELVGPSDSTEARMRSAKSLRALYGKDTLHNAVHATDDKQLIEKEMNLFFPHPTLNRKAPQNTAKLKNISCCVVKPHAVQARLLSAIIDDIQKAGFTISALQQFHVDNITAEEFLEVYKGVIPDYTSMVAELHSGPCVVMEISHEDSEIDVPSEFRKLCGPMDPETARQLRPNTLRAKYGKTKVQNAVHCSDLPEDGVLEVEYFFKILVE